MLRCSDNSLYTGIASDFERRINEHFNKSKKCAKYTRSHTAKQLEAVWECENKSLAASLECCIKKLAKLKKEELIANNNLNLLQSKIDVAAYKRIEINTNKSQ